MPAPLPADPAPLEEQPLPVPAPPEPAPLPEPPAAPQESEEAPAAPAAPEPAPAAAAATVPVPKMTAFQRGALRALGIGELVARVEAAETAAATHAAENAALTQRLAALSAALPLQVAAAATGHANEVSVQVRSELSALGVSAATAPPQISAADADKILARGEFDKLSHAERNQFFRNGGKLTN